MKTIKYIMVYEKIKKLQSPVFGVLIDIDGVILNTEEFFQEGLKRAYKEFKKYYGSILKFEEFEKFYLLSRDFVKRLHSGYGLSSSRLLYFKTMFNLLSIPYNLEILSRLNEIYWEAVIKKAKPPKDLKEFLELCNKNFIRVGIITELDIDTQILKIEKAVGEDWSEYIDVVITTHEIGVNKKNPAIYLQAINLLGIHNPLNVLLIDNDEENLKAAELVGLQTIHFGEEAKDFTDIIKYLSLEDSYIENNNRVVYFDLFGVIIEEAHFSKIFRKIIESKVKKFVRHKYLLWSMGLLSYEDLGLKQQDIENIIKNIRINQDSIKIAKRLYDNGIKIGIFSNVPKDIFEGIDIPSYFNENLIIISGDYRRRKPDSLLTYIAIKKANTIPKNVYFIDDRPENLKTVKIYKANSVLLDVKKEYSVYPWISYKISNIKEILNILDL